MKAKAQTEKKMEKHLGSEGRVLFRYSGTEKKARIMIEGNDEEKISQMLDELAEKTISCIDRHSPAPL